MRQLRGLRSFVSKKQLGIFGAIFALLAQPLALVPINSASAAPITNNVVINEVNSFTDEVELYNGTPTPVSVNGWTLTEHVPSTGATGNTITLNGTIASGGYLVFTVNGINDTGGDRLSLVRADASEDNVVFGSVAGQLPLVMAPSTGQTVQRDGDGGASWILGSSTIGAANVRFSAPAPEPNATLSAPSLPSPQDVNTANDFTSTVSGATNSAGVNVRVKTTFTQGSPSDVVFDYYQAGAPNEGYLPLVRDGNDFYFGPTGGFPLQNASSSFRLIFTKVGTYTATSQIINAQTLEPIGNSVTQTVTVKHPDVPTAAPQSTITVRESEFATSGWGFYNDDRNVPTTEFTPSYEYAVDPTNPGKDTLKFSHPTDKMNLATNRYADTLLRDISAIGYDSYNQSGRSTYIQFNVDFDGSGDWQGRLTYIPASTSGAWQSNEGVQNGNGLWQWSGNLNGTTAWPGPDGITTKNRTWNDIVASYPNARINVGALGGLNVRSEPGSVNYINNVYVATASSNIKYNFMEDSTGPTISGLSVSEKFTNKNTITVTGTITDPNLAEYKYQILDENKQNVLGEYGWSKVGGTSSVEGGALFTADIANLRLDGTTKERLPDGKYFIRVWATDTFGNSTGIATRQYVEFTVDTRLDMPAVSTSNNDTPTRGNVTVTITANEPITISDSAWSPVGSSGRVWISEEFSSNTTVPAAVTVEDRAGNTRSVPYRVTGIDKEAPVITVTGEPLRNNDGTYLIQGTTSDSTDQVTVVVNGDNSYTAFVASDATWFVNVPLNESLEGVANTIAVNASDFVGNPANFPPFEYIALTPFTPTDRSGLGGADPIVNNVVDDTPIRNVAYVPQVNTGATDNDNGNVLGTTDDKAAATTTPPVVEPSEEGWRLLGLAWYWWVIILGALAAAVWAGLKWYRGRGQVA